MHGAGLQVVEHRIARRRVIDQVRLELGVVDQNAIADVRPRAAAGAGKVDREIDGGLIGDRRG
jgi:hypothetical protein